MIDTAVPIIPAADWQAVEGCTRQTVTRAFVRERCARQESMCADLQRSLIEPDNASGIKEESRRVFRLGCATGVGRAEAADALFVQSKTARLRNKRNPQDRNTD